MHNVLCSLRDWFLKWTPVCCGFLRLLKNPFCSILDDICINIATCFALDAWSFSYRKEILNFQCLLVMVLNYYKIMIKIQLIKSDVFCSFLKTFVFLTFCPVPYGAIQICVTLSITTLKTVWPRDEFSSVEVCSKISFSCLEKSRGLLQSRGPGFCYKLCGHWFLRKKVASANQSSTYMVHGWHMTYEKC